MHTPWTSISVRSLFPQLDVNNGDSLLSKVYAEVSGAKQSLTDKISQLQSVVDMANTAVTRANQALSAIQTEIEAISDTGQYITIVTSEGGKTSFSNAITTALNAEDAPEIPSAAGALLIVVTGPNADNVMSKITQIKAPMRGL